MTALVIDILDAIGGDLWGGGVSSRSVNRALLENGEAKAITVRINSPGGDVFEGHTIHNLLAAHRPKVKVEILGLAASMASIVALAGDRVSMAENALFMIHNPWSLAIGDGDGMRRAANKLDKVKGTLLALYQAKTGLSRDELSDMMDAETWFTASEALEAGFIDEVVPARAAPAESEAAVARSAAIVAQFQHAPDVVCARYGGLHVAAMAQTGPRKENHVERDKIIALLGLPKDATDEQIEAALKRGPEASTPAPVNLNDFVPRADFDAMRAQLAAREQAERERQRREFEARVEEAVSGALRAGKITPVSADWHRNSCLRGGDEALAEFERFVDLAPEIAGNDQMQRAKARDTGSPGASLSPEDRKLLASIGVTIEEIEETRADMRSKPDIYPAEIYGLE